MGLGTKLNFAFIVVIAIVVLAHGGLQIFFEHKTATDTARMALDETTLQLNKEIDEISKFNQKMAGKLSSDGAFNQAYNAKDHGGVASAARAFLERNGLPGYVAVFDRTGRVFYSGDSPAKNGYEPLDIVDEIQNLLREGRIWYGPAAPTQGKILSLIGMVPIKSGSSTIGLVALCQPVNGEFLIGLQKKLELIHGLKNIELLLYSMRDGHVQALTAGLEGSDGGFVASLNREGPKVIKGAVFESNQRLWKTAARFETADRHVTDYILSSAPLPDLKKQLTSLLLQAAISGVVALVLAFIFSASIAGGCNRSISLLVQRAKDLGAHKSNLPPLDNIGSEFYELAELIDHAVASPRSSVKSLQSQMGKSQEELAEKQAQVDEANNKVEAMNKQLMIQSKQLSEVSKQINYGNAQAVLLQQKFASVLQISTEGFLILDPFGNILSANPAFTNWAGCPESELAGRFCFDVVRKPGQGKDESVSTPFAMRSGSPGDLIAEFFPEGVIFHSRQDKSIDVLLHLQPVMMDEQTIQGYIMVVRDKSLHSEAARLRTEIVAMLQESIRTPLTTAEQKWTSVLNTASQAGGGAVGQTLIDLHSSYQQLLAVVDSLLMMHTGIVPTAPIAREQISMTRLIGDCLEQTSQKARTHQVMLDYKTITGLPTTAISGQIIREVIVELLEKMISVTAPGGRVRVESAAKGSEIRVSIFSSGPALPAAEIEDMFAGFIQGKHAEDTYSQRLSMYLVRNSIERVGGRIWAEADRGTYIYFVLPVQ